jgi:hypothetical protein
MLFIENISYIYFNPMISNQKNKSFNYIYFFYTHYVIFSYEMY